MAKLKQIGRSVNFFIQKGGQHLQMILFTLHICAGNLPHNLKINCNYLRGIKENGFQKNIKALI